MFGFKKKVSKKDIAKSVDDFNKLWEADISSIWEISNKNQFLIAMEGWLCRKCNYGDEIEKLSSAERIFFINTLLESEVNNGGFSQFFYNSSGNFANEVISSLLAIGAVKTAEIYKEAFAHLGEDFPSDSEERENFLDKIVTDDIEAKWNKCDGDFYEYPDPLEDLNYQFIMQHKNQFS